MIFFRFSVLVERAKVIVFKISPKSVTYVAYLLNCFYNNKFLTFNTFRFISRQSKTTNKAQKAIFTISRQ